MSRNCSEIREFLSSRRARMTPHQAGLGMLAFCTEQGTGAELEVISADKVNEA